MGNCNWINTNNNNNCNCNTQNNNNCNCNTQNYNTQTCNTTKNYNNQATTTQNDCCCCAGSFRRALALLSDPVLSQYINFDEFVFVSDQISVGGFLAAAVGAAATNNPDDNIAFAAAPNNASFQCVDCNLVRIATTTGFYLVREDIAAVAGPGTLVEVPLNQLSLCDLIAVKFTVDDDAFATTPTNVNECLANCTISNYNSFKTYFRSLLDKKNANNNNCKTTCDDCCCNEDILNQVNTCIAGPRGATVNISAGTFFGLGLEVLGQVGCVLVLTDNNVDTETDTTDPSIFLVCVDRIAGFTA
jgi:hypothetical protein